MIGLGVGLLGMVPASALLTRWYAPRSRPQSASRSRRAGWAGCCSCPRCSAAGNVSLAHVYQILGLLMLCAAPLAALAVPWKSFVAGDPELRVSQKGRAAAEGWTVRAAMRTRLYWALVQVFFFTSIAMFTVLVQAVVYSIDIGFSPIAAASAYGLIGMFSVGVGIGERASHQTGSATAST
jgi:hypothetical protein